MRYAGFWVRACAALFDALICLPANIVIAIFVANAFDVPVMATYGPHAEGRPGHILEILSFLFGLIYYVASSGSAWQATPGKLLVGIRIIRPDGANVAYPRAFLRYFDTVFSGLILGGGLLMVAFTREKTALHDLLCDTRVVYRVRSA